MNVCGTLIDFLLAIYKKLFAIILEKTDVTRLTKSKPFTNRKQKPEEKSNSENCPLKIEVTIPKVPSDEDKPEDKKDDDTTNFRNKVKLFQTKTMLSKAFGEGGAERFASRKMRMESNLGINVGDNLN